MGSSGVLQVLDDFGAGFALGVTESGAWPMFESDNDSEHLRLIQAATSLLLKVKERPERHSSYGLLNQDRVRQVWRQSPA